MRAILVHPRFPVTYWGVQYGLPIAGKRATLPPLGLVTLAALLPADWELRLVDMNIEALTVEHLTWCDAVLVGGMLVQSPSMIEVIARAKALGKRTIVGGPAASTSPELFTEADAVFGGEAEGHEAEVIALIEGRPVPATSGASTCGSQTVIPLRKDKRPDVKTSPVPRFDLLDLSAYSSMSIQYSRGCPFRCEFCDIIEIFGRIPRMKTPAQVIAELDALTALGWRGSLFVVDDNFIGNVKEVRKLLPELQKWQVAHAFSMDFYTEASVNLACDEPLVAAMVAAGFSSVFLGIETPNEESLKETQKTQNLRMDLDEAIARLTRAGMEVMGGFIVGFDSDDASAFAKQEKFLRDAPIPLAMVGILTALPDTQLWRRLEGEGRLRVSVASGEQMERPNFRPTMDEEELLRGYSALVSQVYSEEGYLRRCLAYLTKAPKRLDRKIRPGGVRTLFRAMWKLGVLSAHRRVFWTLLFGVLRRDISHVAWAVEKAIQGEHFLRFTEEDLVPRLDRAIADVRAEQLAAAA